MQIIFLQIIACGYISAQLLKQSFLHAKSGWKYLKIQILQKYPQVIVEKTENSPNSSSYTIEYKLVRNSHLLSQNWHFFQVSQQLFGKQV